jgi:uncharacterized iron-regulated membrane protein
MEEPVLALSDVDRFLDSVAEAVPGWRTIDMTLPAATDRRVDFRIDESFGGQPQSRTTLSINRHTGDIVGMTTFDDQNTGQRARSWLRFVHTGEYYGMIGQTIAGIASLAGAFLVYTGFALSIRRFYAWRGRR